jgi:sugar phosphate permease
MPSYFARSLRKARIAYRWIILVFGMLAYTTSFFARSNYTGIAKFVSADLGLDRASLGVMGAVFFYSYALAQMPWGVVSDKWGNRKAVATGIFVVAATLWGFSTSGDYTELKVWRVLNGVAAAAVYVGMAGALSRWFSPRERGFSQSLFAGVGGAAGEIAANVVLPVIIVYAGYNWRSSTVLMAAVIAVVGVACLLFLKSAPPGQSAIERRPFEWHMLKDVRLWCFTAIYSGFIIALRILPPWLPIFAADIYISQGMSLDSAVVAGGLLTTFYLAGRVLGVPSAGFLSDRLMLHGFSRKTVAMVFLFLTVGLLQALSMGVSSTWVLAAIACLMGMTINTYPLITTAVSETFGPAKTSSVMGFVNTWAQLCGATALALSGYMGIALSTEAGNSLEEYRGIWLVGMGGCLLAAGLGVILSYAVWRAGERTAAVLADQSAGR